MTSARGIVGIIGIRAEIIGVRQYLADGREIERINDHLAASTKRIEASNVSLQRSEGLKRAAFKQAQTDLVAAIAARQKVLKLEQDLAAASAKVVAKPPAPTGLVGTSGQPISSATTATNTAAIAQTAKLKTELKAANAEFDNLARVAVLSSRAEHSAVGQFVADSNTKKRLLQEETRLNEELAAAQRSRIRAGATTVAIAGTAIIGATAAGAITQAAKYEQALSKINVLTNATDEETAQLGERFKTLSTQIPISATDLALASYQALSSGITNVTEAYDLTVQAAKAAAAGQADVKTVVSAVTTVLNAYPKGLINANQVTDILFATVRAGKGEFNDLANSIGRVLPSAVALGVKFTEVGAAMAAMTNAGLNAEEAATALRAILQDLATNDDSTKTAEALKTIGITSEQLRQSIKDKGLAPALVELFKLFGDNLTALEPIIPNIRALTGAFIAFGKSGENLAAIQASVNKSVGIVDQSFEKTRNNAANLAKLFSNQVNVALIEIGTAILPSVTRALQDLIGWLQNNRKEIQSFVSQGLQGIIDIGREAVKGIKLIADVLSFLSGVMSSIVGQSNATKLALAAIGTGLAFALPGGPVIVGLTAILVLLGQIQDLTSGGGDRSAKGLIDKFGLPLAGGIAGGAIGFGAGGPFGAVLGAGIGAQGGGLLRDALGLNPDKKGKTNTVQDTIDQIEKANKAFGDLNNQALKDIPANIAGINQKAKEAAEELKKLAQEFEKTSEAAGQVASITEEFKKFGTISKELADAAGLSAAQSGQVQAVDAIIRAREREQAEIFNNIQAINAIAGAYQRSAQVGRELLLQLAQASLEASQQALSNVFGRPTREVADLGVPLARQQLTTAQRELRNTPAINALQQQLRNIDRQIAAQNRANQIANRNAARQREQQQKAQQAAQKAAQRAQEDQANALKLANLIAQINAERQLAALQKLIDANNKAASDLQEAFLKSNNELQVQINTAIGKGDSATALSLVDQQRAATKAYREQQTALTKSTQNLTTQQKAAQEAEAERQRQAQLAEALLQSQQRQQESTDNLSDSLDSAKEAQDAQTQAMEDSKQAIQDQIDALQGPIDQSKEQEAAIQRQIAVYEAQTNILKAQGVAADKTLLTQEQQRQAAEHFTAQIEYASGQAKALADNFYAFIPGAKEADLTFKTLRDTVNAINTNTFPGLVGNFDAVTARLDLLKKATEDVTTTFNNSATQTAQKAAENQQIIDLAISNALSDIQTQKGEIATEAGIFKAKMQSATDDAGSAIRKLPDKFSSVIDSFAKKINSIDIGGLFKGLKGLLHAQGGIFTKPTLGIIGEAGPEVVLPLNDVKRITQILQQASVNKPGLVATTGNVSNAANIFSQISSAGSLSEMVSSSAGSVDFGTVPIGQRSANGGGGTLVKWNGITMTAASAAALNFQRVSSTGDISGGYINALSQASQAALAFKQYRPGLQPIYGSQAASVGSTQVIAQLSPQLTAALAAKPAASAVFAPNITVTGQTLDTMEAVALQAVRDAFRDARLVSGRTGGLITTGLGPSH